MKQGSENNTSAYKGPAQVNKVSVPAVSQMGQAGAEKPKQLYVGRKTEAPKSTVTSHSSGTQGKY